MAKAQIKSENSTPFGGIFFQSWSIPGLHVFTLLSTRHLVRDAAVSSGYQYSEIIRSLMSVYFCGGSCVEDVTSHLMRHLSYHPTLRTCSSDTILRAIKELTQENISYTSDKGQDLWFQYGRQAQRLAYKKPWFPLVNWMRWKPTMLISTISSLKQEKYDAKPTYKKFSATDRVYVIGDMIVYVENSDGNNKCVLLSGWRPQEILCPTGSQQHPCESSQSRLCSKLEGNCQ